MWHYWDTTKLCSRLNLISSGVVLKKSTNKSLHRKFCKKDVQILTFRQSIKRGNSLWCLKENSYQEFFLHFKILIFQGILGVLAVVFGEDFFFECYTPLGIMSSAMYVNGRNARKCSFVKYTTLNYSAKCRIQLVEFKLRVLFSNK